MKKQVAVKNDLAQPERITFEDYVSLMKLPKEKVDHLVEQFRMSKNIISMVLNGRYKELRVMRPKDL